MTAIILTLFLALFQPLVFAWSHPKGEQKVDPKTGAIIYVLRNADPVLTPGATFMLITKEDVCTPGYTKLVRDVDSKKKKEVFKRYGIPQVPWAYEVDHLVSLELGGSNELTNLWPEAYDSPSGARQKDVVENYLHRQVCAGKITLKQAQELIKGDWYKIYLEFQEMRRKTGKLGGKG